MLAATVPAIAGLLLLGAMLIGGQDGLVDMPDVRDASSGWEGRHLLPEGHQALTSDLRGREIDAPAIYRFLRWNAGGMGDQAVEPRGSLAALPTWIPQVDAGRAEAGASDWREIVCDNRPWDCSWAIDTVLCESGGDWAAAGSEWYDSDFDGIPEQWYFHGLWQHASLSSEPGPLVDPAYNTDLAEQKYRANGKAPWPACGYLLP